MSSAPILTGDRCPVCKQMAVAIIDQVAGIPVTVCLNCDYNEAIKQFPWQVRWRIRVHAWALTMEIYGTWALACAVLTMFALFVLVMGVEQEWRRLTVFGVGIACQMAAFLLYLRLIRLYLRARRK